MGLAIPTMLFLAAVILVQLPEADAADRPCYLWVRGWDEYNVKDDDDNLRNNPDGTLYPGDAFTYHFQWSFSRFCHSQKVDYPSDSGAVNVAGGGKSSGIAEILIPQATQCLGAPSGGGGGKSGWDVDWEETRRCGYVSLTISAIERHCNDGGCSSHLKKRTAYVHPDIMAPIVEVGLQEHIIRDPDGYIAANDDYTNYPWDPIAIEHDPEFIYKNERAGTISFEYDRMFAPLAEEGGYECDRLCDQFLTVEGGIPNAHGTGYLPYPNSSPNGGGMYAYTAVKTSDAGFHDIIYDVTVLNEGKAINRHTNSTKQLVVLYDPKFEHYEYPVLEDAAKYSYDDRQGIVMHYFGSNGIGQGDENKLHETRRSKINAFHPVTTSISRGYNIDPIHHDPGLLKWDSIDHINGTDHAPWVSSGDHAMFEVAGYGVLRLNQEIADAILTGENERRWYENTTTYNTINSDEWAGHENYENFEYTYQYPHTPFAEWYNMVAYTADGKIDQIPMTVSAVPINSTDNSNYEFGDRDRITVWLDDYLHDKTVHDTGDEHFATAVVDDTYQMSLEGSGTGTLEMWQNKTGLEFSKGFVTLGDLKILEIPMYDALDMDAKMQFDMTAGGANKAFNFIPDFENPHNEIVNINDQNTIDAHRVVYGNATTSLIEFAMQKHFGDVVTVKAGDKIHEYGTVCDEMCSVTDHEQVLIEVENGWGGKASHTVNAASPAERVRDSEQVFENATEYLIFIFSMALLAFVVYKAVSRVIRSLNDAESAEPK